LCTKSRIYYRILPLFCTTLLSILRSLSNSLMVCIAETFHIIDPELHGFAAIDKIFQLAISKAGLKLKVFWFRNQERWSSKLYLSNSLDQLSGTAKQAYICKTPLEKIKRATRGAAWRRPRAGFRDFLSMKGQCSRSSPDRSCSESFRCTNTAVGWSKREEKSSDAASIKALLTHQ
jgi:hypothetical protein